jgi:hypothetical protein
MSQTDLFGIPAEERIKYVESNLFVMTKDSKLVPMMLWPAQKDYIRHRTHRDIVLKGRQMGFSTGIEADDACALFTLPFQRQAIITHDTETSEFLLQNVHRFWRNLPKEKQPKVDWSSAYRIRFPLIDNYIYIDSAKSDSLGIGHTLNCVHLSETSRWQEQRARDLYAGISQTVPLDGVMTIESTPRGRAGIFYELYMSAKRNDIPYKAHFYPWWWDPNYTLPVEKKLELTSDEKLMVKHYNLTEGQIAFRRLKQSELKELFFQEYPESDQDCWLSSDIAVVSGVILKPYYLAIKEPRMEDDHTAIWKDVIGGRKYIMGVDVAAGYEKGDFSVASVLDVRTLEYVARIKGRMPPDLFAEKVFRLGLRFNQALIAVERAGHGHSVLRTLLEKDYPNLYYHVDYDDILQATRNEPGWKTSLKTKPTMVTDLVAAIRAQDLISWSENFVTEAAGLTWEGMAGGGKVKPTFGGHDDEWDAVSIALQIREQTPIIDEGRARVTSYVRL